MFPNPNDEVVFHVYVPDEHSRVKVISSNSNSMEINAGMYLQMILSGLVSIVIIVLSVLIIGNFRKLQMVQTSDRFYNEKYIKLY